MGIVRTLRHARRYRKYLADGWYATSDLEDILWGSRERGERLIDPGFLQHWDQAKAIVNSPDDEPPRGAPSELQVAPSLGAPLSVEPGPQKMWGFDDESPQDAA